MRHREGRREGFSAEGCLIPTLVSRNAQFFFLPAAPARWISRRPRVPFYFPPAPRPSSLFALPGPIVVKYFPLLPINLSSFYRTL